MACMTLVPRPTVIGGERRPVEGGRESLPRPGGEVSVTTHTEHIGLGMRSRGVHDEPCVSSWPRVKAHHAAAVFPERIHFSQVNVTSRSWRVAKEVPARLLSCDPRAKYNYSDHYRLLLLTFVASSTPYLRFLSSTTRRASPCLSPFFHNDRRRHRFSRSVDT